MLFRCCTFVLVCNIADALGWCAIFNGTGYANIAKHGNAENWKKSANNQLKNLYLRCFLPLCAGSGGASFAAITRLSSLFDRANV